MNFEKPPEDSMNSQEKRKELERPEGKWARPLNQMDNRKEDNGTYGENNGFIAYQTSPENGVGDILVAPLSEERRKDLESKGYKNTGLGVPFSNGIKKYEDVAEWKYQFPEHFEEHFKKQN